MNTVTARLAPGDATSSSLAALLRLVAARRSVAARITAQIGEVERRMNALLYRRVPGAGEMLDAIEDEILGLRAELMTNDVAMMDLVEQARRANEHRTERHRLDLEAAFRAMPAIGDDHRSRAAPGS